MANEVQEDFERPCLEPKGTTYRLVKDWHTDCKGVLDYKIMVPAGFVTDGTSIPRILWTICGSPMDNPRIYAAIVHDYLYELGGTKDDRKKADTIYRDYQIALGISKIKAYTEYYSLHLCGGTYWKTND